MDSPEISYPSFSISLKTCGPISEKLGRSPTTSVQHYIQLKRSCSSAGLLYWTLARLLRVIVIKAYKSELFACKVSGFIPNISAICKR